MGKIHHFKTRLVADCVNCLGESFFTYTVFLKLPEVGEALKAAKCEKSRAVLDSLESDPDRTFL